MQLVADNIKADLFFFDGRIAMPDLPLILRLSHPRTVYLFDDFKGGEKGVVNVQRLSAVLPNTWASVQPDRERETTLAAIIPMEMLTS